MSEIPSETAEPNIIQQSDFEQITALVSAEFQTEEALLEHNIPTYYLKQPQETKKAFLKLLKSLEKPEVRGWIKISKKPSLGLKPETDPDPAERSGRRL